MPVKAQGRRGSWVADYEGSLLPCVHDCWKKGDHYADPEIVPGSKFWRPNFIEVLKERRRVLLTRDKLVDGYPRGRARGPNRYLSVWEIDDVRVDEALRFRFVRQLA